MPSPSVSRMGQPLRSARPALGRALVLLVGQTVLVGVDDGAALLRERAGGVGAVVGVVGDAVAVVVGVGAAVLVVEGVAVLLVERALVHEVLDAVAVVVELGALLRRVLLAGAQGSTGCWVKETPAIRR
jgi:hypothetical protein